MVFCTYRQSGMMDCLYPFSCRALLDTLPVLFLLFPQSGSTTHQAEVDGHGRSFRDGGRVYCHRTNARDVLSCSATPEAATAIFIDFLKDVVLHIGFRPEKIRFALCSRLVLNSLPYSCSAAGLVHLVYFTLWSVWRCFTGPWKGLFYRQSNQSDIC